MLSIKSATTADIPLIRELTMLVWPQTYTPIVGNEQVAYMLGMFYNPEALKNQMEQLGHHFIICFMDGLPAAFASWSEVEASVFKLHKIYIIPHRQGRGVGKAMLSYVIADIKTRGATALLLNVNRYNLAAKAFYEKAGFKHVKNEDVDIGNGYFMNDHVLKQDVSQK